VQAGLSEIYCRVGRRINYENRSALEVTVKPTVGPILTGICATVYITMMPAGRVERCEDDGTTVNTPHDIYATSKTSE